MGKGTRFAALGATLVIAAAGCGEEAGALDCAQACEKSRECATSTTAFNDEACRSSCEGTKSLVQEGFQGALMACLDEDCGDRDACAKEAARECEPPPSFDDFVSVLCDKTAECQEEVTAAQCRMGLAAAMAQSGGQVLNCLNEAAIGTLDDCLGKAECLTFQKDIEACLGAALGLDLTGTAGPSGGGAAGGS